MMYFLIGLNIFLFLACVGLSNQLKQLSTQSKTLTDKLNQQELVVKDMINYCSHLGSAVGELQTYLKDLQLVEKTIPFHGVVGSA